MPLLDELGYQIPYLPVVGFPVGVPREVVERAYQRPRESYYSGIVAGRMLARLLPDPRLTPELIERMERGG
jgi:hypothetical protein